MRLLAILGLLTLAACGVDGPPVRPGPATAQPGVSVTGEARIGVLADDL